MLHLWSPSAQGHDDHDDHDDADDADDSPARVGFVVARGVGGAVARNRVRRRLRHLVRERLSELPAASVLVVRALPEAAAASYDELRDDLGRCLVRVLPTPVTPQTTL